MITKRAAIFCAVLMAICLSPNLAAAKNLKLAVHSAILMDMTTGRVLFTQNPNTPIQPASITKVLTLYLADEAIRDGRVRPGDPVEVGCLAAGRDGLGGDVVEVGRALEAGERGDRPLSVGLHALRLRPAHAHGQLVGRCPDAGPDSDGARLGPARSRPHCGGSSAPA